LIENPIVLAFPIVTIARPSCSVGLLAPGDVLLVARCQASFAHRLFDLFYGKEVDFLGQSA